MMHHHRALTLLELLIALTLIVALGAIAFPMLVDQLPGRRYDEAAEMLVQQCGLARAHAQREGIIVELVCEPETGRVTARRSALNDAIGVGDDRDDGSSLLGMAGGEDDAAFMGEGEDGAMASAAPGGDWLEDDEAEQRIIAAGWAVYRLPNRLRLTLSAPAEEPSGDMGSAEALARLEAEVRADLEDAEARAMADLQGGEAPFRIAVFLPDGSALVARPAWLIDDRGGRAGVITIDGWTGQARFNRREISDEDDLADELEDGEEDDAFDAMGGEELLDRAGDRGRSTGGADRAGSSRSDDGGGGSGDDGDDGADDEGSS